MWDTGTGDKVVNVAIAPALPPPNVEKLGGVLSFPPSASTTVKMSPQQLDWDALATPPIVPVHTRND